MYIRNIVKQAGLERMYAIVLLFALQLRLTPQGCDQVPLRPSFAVSILTQEHPWYGIYVVHLWL